MCIFFLSFSAAELADLVTYMISDDKDRKVWQNAHGQTSSIRNHLRIHHEALWLDIVVSKELKGWQDVRSGSAQAPNTMEREPFSLVGFYERLLKWIAVDDQVCVFININEMVAELTTRGQSINVVESPELRNLLLYIGTQLHDGHIPHRTKLSELITERFKVEHAAMIQDLRVHFICQSTSSSTNLSLSVHWGAWPLQVMFGVAKISTCTWPSQDIT